VSYFDNGLRMSSGVALFALSCVMFDLRGNTRILSAASVTEGKRFVCHLFFQVCIVLYL
jgi:hypothetical protein